MTQSGFFETYFITPFFRKYADFGGSESGKSALVSLMAWLIVTAGVAGALVGLVGLLGPETGFACLFVIGGLWVAGSLCPLVALAARAARAGGDKPQPVRFLGIDTFLAVTCGLFLILGILMAVTTLNSGVINPYHRGQGERKGNPILEQEEVYEEPIFNYQTEEPVPVEDPAEEEAVETPDDTITIDDTFDPTIETTIDLDTLAIN